jgi:nucleotide-binding universal stress UspA family protein
MFKNVLVGVDGSPNGHDAIALARRLADSDGKLTLAHVHSGALNPLNAVQRDLLREDREASAKLLEAELAVAEVDARLESVEASSPAGGLHRLAEQQGADLLVVGSCRHGVLGRAMLGDDARASLNGAPCAVAVAARGYAEAPTPLARVGVAYNGSPESRAALSFAQRLGAAQRASVEALEVVSIPTMALGGIMFPYVGDTMKTLLDEALARMQALPDVAGSAVYGLSGEELATFSDQLDVLVVGSRGYGPVKRLVLGSTSDHLARHARCSLLVLPRAARNQESGTASDGAAQSEAEAGAVG